MSRISGLACALVVGICFSSAAFAEIAPAEANRPDFSARINARTYSPGLSLNPQVGYAQSLWGDITTPWYGFVRPYITGLVSPTILEAKGGIELFPVSILGVDLRRSFSRRFTSTRGQDCDQVQCMGALNYTDLSFQTFLAFGGYFSSVRWTRTFFDAVEDRTRPIFEVGASVLLSPNGENSDMVSAAIGKNLSETASAGVLLQVTDYHTSRNHQDAQYLFYKTDCAQFGYDNLEATVGIGRFYSSRNVPEASAILSISYTGARAIGFGR